MKVATLLSIIGAETYKLLRDLSHPKLPKERKYDELMVLLTKQYGPQVNVWRERRKFYKAKQEINENVADYYARIRSLSVNCNFEKNLTDILKDKLISGLKRGPILDQVCEEETDKSLEELVTLALKRENQETNHEQGKEVNFMKKFQGSERIRANQGHGSGSNHHHHVDVPSCPDVTRQMTARNPEREDGLSVLNCQRRCKQQEIWQNRYKLQVLWSRACSAMQIYGIPMQQMWEKGSSGKSVSKEPERM
ncbi:hypothetical protein NQ315_014239 [Exocentrus adspersus]|uniref:Retrotransposon gag domain-containing protein n=1 Tax=Exocentrus adspersus TaxID=1586481 RepID=A0AAV8VC85_9CUCU|nr:hypothetical protein NQ315_014239 [Exocentrus adspersus]